MKVDLEQRGDGSVTLTFRLTRKEHEQFVREVDDEAVLLDDATGLVPWPPLPVGAGRSKRKKYCVTCGGNQLNRWTVTASSKIEASVVGAFKCAPEPLTGVREGKCRSVLVSTKKKKKKKPPSNDGEAGGSGPGSRW